MQQLEEDANKYTRKWKRKTNRREKENLINGSSKNREQRGVNYQIKIQNTKKNYPDYMRLKSPAENQDVKNTHAFRLTTHNHFWHYSQGISG